MKITNNANNVNNVNNVNNDRGHSNNGLLNLEHLPAIYANTKSLTVIIEEVWEIIVKYTHALHKNTNEKEIIDDFCVHFYENLPNCFTAYEKRRHIPFAAFMLSYQKNLFYNFIRFKERRKLQQDLHYEISPPQKSTDLFFIRNAFFLEEKTKEKYFSCVPILLRITAKLYVGMELTIEELKLLVYETKCPQKASQFLMERRERQERRMKLWEKYENRKAHLHSLIHRADSMEKERELIERKHKTQKIAEAKTAIHEMAHLSRLFGVSKSTICRRLAIAANHLEKSKA